MPYLPVPGRLSRPKLERLKKAQREKKWWERALDAFDVFLGGGTSGVSYVVHPTTGVPHFVRAVAVGRLIVPDLPEKLVPPCPGGPVGCVCRARNGVVACPLVNDWAAGLCASVELGLPCTCASNGYKACASARRRQLHKMPVGALQLSDFAGSPQLHAALNRHLVEYFAGVRRAKETTPYAIPASQEHLLADLGMEPPPLDAPVVPHGLHKSIEEFQLRRMRQFLPPNAYGLTCVKSSKVGLLPPCGGFPMNPLREAKDPSRFPGSALSDADFSAYNVQFMHDVAAEVTPHELVEKLVSENPEAQLFVTGMLPAEVLEGATCFEPSSHVVEYDGAGYNCVFTGSEAESYFTPIDVAMAWYHSSSVVASNGRTYHVVLLDNKLGHCLFHIFCGDVTEQHTRTFPTGSMVKLPAALTGTWRSAYVPQKLVVATLNFVARTPDLSTRNLAAKVSMVANAVNPRTTAKERWIMEHVMGLLAPIKTWDYRLRRGLWKVAYAATLQWHMLTELPDVFTYVDERKRFFTIHPTQGGGWSPQPKFMDTGVAIPNDPSWLQRLSAFTAWTFLYVLPKLFVGEALTHVVLHVSPVTVGRKLMSWFQPEITRLLLTVLTAVIVSIVPSRVAKFMSHWSGHFHRQLWWPYRIGAFFLRTVVELTGAPGSRWAISPGHGWAWQALLWAVALHSLVPGLVPALVVPWIAYANGWGWLMSIWLAAVVVENVAVSLPIIHPGRFWHTRLGVASLALTRPGVSLCDAASFLSSVAHNGTVLARRAFILLQIGLSNFAHATGNCGRKPTLPMLPKPPEPMVTVRRVDRPLPAVVVQPNLPVAPVGVALAVPPDGLNFPEWIAQVENAYRNTPPAYPQLTPGEACFWDCVATLGGSSHMWYSWFMAFMRRTAAPTGVIGNVTVPDMHIFAAVSGIGLRITGLTDEAVLAANGRPTLNVVLSRSAVRGCLHVETALTPTVAPNTAPFARLLATMLRHYPGWHAQVVAWHNAAAVDACPVPTDELKAIMGDHPLPRTMDEVASGINECFSVVPFTAAAPDGFTLALVGSQAAGRDLFDYQAQVSTVPVAKTSSGELWRGYRIGATPRTGHPRRAGRAYTSKIWNSWRKKPVGATPRQAVDNATRNNPAPAVPMWVALMNELRDKVKDYMGFWLPCVPLQEEVITYVADVDRAARLVSDLKAHPEVLSGKATTAWLQSLDSIIDTWRAEGKTRSIKVRCYIGVFGSGKTTATAAYIRGLSEEMRANVKVVSHTESLREQAKRALDFPGLKGTNFPTLQGLLSESASGPIVWDDAGQFWGGTLDLAALVHPLVPEMVVNGCPSQQLARFPVGGTQSEFDVGPMVVAQQATRWATLSHRSFGLLTETFGVHTTNPVRGHITHTISGKQGLPVVTASPRYVGVLSGSGREARTYNTVQGEDFNCDMEVDMSAMEEAMSDRSASVALTRSKTGVYLHMNVADPRSVLKAPPSGSDLLNAILYSLRADGSPTLLRGNELTRAAFYAHLHTCMPNLVWFAPVGATLGPGAYQSVVEACETTFAVDGTCEDSIPVEPVQVSSPPLDLLIQETHWVDRESRELSRAGVQTQQFKETAFVNPHVHKRSDHATYRLTKEKRVLNGTRARNLVRKQLCPRTDMINELSRLVPVMPKWTPEKHEHYVDRARVEYESGRSAAAVQAKLDAHDPERSNKDAVNSVKAQVIAKDEKRHKLEAIPGQMIWEYDIAHTLEDAAYTLFLEEELFAAFPPNFLFYRRMNPAQFIDAYKARWRVNNGIHTSDVTRWDYGCDAGVLNFDEHLMNACGFPADYVRAYVDRRLETKTQHGVVQTTQPSGDRYTWTLNSIRRAVVASILHDIQPEDTVAINGDDEAMDRCSDGGVFPDSPWEFKDQNGFRGDFSGFELGGAIPEYSATGILYRTHILISRDPSAVEKWVNYMALLALADCDTTEAGEVARLAREHMPDDLFRQTLPPQLRKLFL